MGAGGAHHRQSISTSSTANSFIPFFLPSFPPSLLLFFPPSSLSLHFFLPSILSAYLPSCLRSYLLAHPKLHTPSTHLAFMALLCTLPAIQSQPTRPSLRTLSARSTTALPQRHGLGHLLKE